MKSPKVTQANSTDKAVTSKHRKRNGSKSLISMLSKVSVSKEESTNQCKVTPKRNRSPGTTLLQNQSRPLKLTKYTAQTQGSSASASAKSFTTPHERGYGSPVETIKNQNGSNQRTSTVTSQTTASDQTQLPAAPKIYDNGNNHTKPSVVPIKMPEATEPEHSYSEVVKESLHLKVCPDNKRPSTKDLKVIKEFINGKIMEALENEDYFPIFNGNELGMDGVYLKCSDFSCASWLRKVIASAEASTNLKLIVLQHDVKVTAPIASGNIRVVTCIPTNKENEWILDKISKLNRNLNTENWHIKRRRPKGTGKTTLYMRIDKESFEIIKAQNHTVFWIMGVITIEQERVGTNSKGNNSSETAVTANRNVAHGSQPTYQKAAPSSKEVWNGYPRSKGQVQKERSGKSAKQYPN